MIGENGYFRISMGNNMCGIGAQAFYLCPDSMCLTNKASIPNSQLPGKFFFFLKWFIYFKWKINLKLLIAHAMD